MVVLWRWYQPLLQGRVFLVLPDIEIRLKTGDLDLMCSPSCSLPYRIMGPSALFSIQPGLS